ncbi:C40 family peptidase [Nocardioides panacihumi]|uniref:C40 family peptidase n=2 Tax=Nocardioides panacihumi TaxID=400774 RepID=A0ABN2R1A9_9ACTN
MVAGFGLACTLGMTAATPAEAKPDIKDVQARVDGLYKDADQATENYNEARLRLAGLQQELSSLRADQQRQDAALAAVREQLRDSMLQQFEGSNLSAVGQVFVSDDPKAFLGQLSTISAYDSLQAGLYHDYSTQLDALRLRRKATEQRTADVAATEKKLAADKKAVETKLADAKQLLSKLQATQRQALLSRDTPRDQVVDVPASGRAAAAVAYAKAQLGDAYVWGATGDNAFDCSGLTMRAWGAAGVSLPHSSRAQYSSGPHVAESDLQPGDLVFFYSPISHVGIYIGNGMVLHAANPSEGVRISPLHSMPYSGAVRPG